jgi:hypothetical protein
MSRVRISGVKELVICADPPPPGSPPLTLVPDPSAAADRTALIEVEDGNLDLIGVNLRLASGSSTRAPKHLVKVTRGSLRLARCFVRGPTTQPPVSFRSLLAVENATGPAVNLAINESILVGGKQLIDVDGGAAHIRVRQSVLVATGDGLGIDASSTYLGNLDLQCQFDSSTLAFGKALASFRWNGQGVALAKPFVVHCSQNVFLDPFLMQPKQSTLLSTDGGTLAKGLLRWQGDGNAYDKRCGPLLTVSGEKLCATVDEWERFWTPGTPQRSLVLDLPDNKRYDLNPLEPELDHLTLPTTLRPLAGESLPGAELGSLGIFRKKTS